MLRSTRVKGIASTRHERWLGSGGWKVEIIQTINSLVAHLSLLSSSFSDPRVSTRGITSYYYYYHHYCYYYYHHHYYYYCYYHHYHHHYYCYHHRHYYYHHHHCHYHNHYYHQRSYDKNAHVDRVIRFCVFTKI